MVLKITFTFLLKYNKIRFLYVVQWMCAVGSHPRTEVKLYTVKDHLILKETCRKYVSEHIDILTCTFWVYYISI